MNLEHLRAGYAGLCYYRGPAEVRAFVGVPVVDDGKLRGVLACDRRDDRPFTGREEQVLESTAVQILRTVENERVFVQLERSKREQTVLYGASQRLGAALTEDEVIDAGLLAAAEITPYDFAAVTLFDEESKKHTVRRAVGEGAEHFAKLTFRDNTSLTAMAVKNKHYLPYKGEFDPRQQVVFTKRNNLKGMASLLIMPLVVRENAIGTIAFAAHRRDVFGASVRPTLSVLANHVAVALANAAAVRRLEEMATTDGLTGCLNKRAFLDELESKMRSAERFDRNLSLLVTDIDHFKTVNDTYGHATGDVVIKELGEILRRVKRETDVVARFGGEEFCVLCEETNAEGAMLLAERIREELEATVFQTDLGRLNVTASIGVATFPDDATHEKGLFDVSDQALYAAKRSGRNKVCTASDR
jgi:diguanylate cyclase (GGDEF)-like protein